MLEPLQVFTGIPMGCRLVLISNNNCEPLIRAGEFVVVDTARREPTFGSLYAIAQSNGPTVWRLYDPLALGAYRSTAGQQEETYYLGPPVPQTFSEVSELAQRSRGTLLTCRMSDGSMYGSALRPKIIGQVIGVFRSDVELDRLAPSHGA